MKILINNSSTNVLQLNGFEIHWIVTHNVRYAKLIYVDSDNDLYSSDFEDLIMLENNEVYNAIAFIMGVNLLMH